MTEKAVERISKLGVRRKFEHWRGAVGPLLGCSHAQRFFRREMMEKCAF
jgi:hypothetical protein